MPFSHDTYTLCIQHGMPEGLSGDDQHTWFVEFLKNQSRDREQIRSSICRAIDFGIRKSKFSTYEDIEDVVNEVFADPEKETVDFFAVLD